MLSCLILHNSSKPFLDQIVMCNEKGFYSMIGNNPQWLDWEEVQSTSQSQTCTKRGHGHSLVVCWWSDPLQLSESQWNHYIWAVCSAHWWDDWKLQCLQLALVNRKGPVLLHPWQYLTACHTTKASKVGRIGQRSFASSTIFPWPLVNWLPLLQTSQQLFAG